MDDIKEWAKEVRRESEKLALERDELTLAMDLQSRELQKLSELQSEKQQLISQYQTQQTKAIASLNINALLLEVIEERFGDLFPEEKKNKRPDPELDEPGVVEEVEELGPKVEEDLKES